MKKFFWAIESRKPIFRSEILTYPKIIETLKKEEKIQKKQKLKVLDMGCGTGKLAERLLKKGYEVFAVDKSKEAVELAKLKNNNIKYFIGDATKKLKFLKDNSFDVIVSTFMTIYLSTSNLSSFMKEMHRILKKKGLLIIGTIHPFLHIIQPKTRWEKWDSKNVNYFSDICVKQTIYLPKDKKGLKTEAFKVKWYHHTFFSYINKLINTNFIITKIDELKPNKKILKTYEKMWKEENKIPVYLIIEARKNKTSKVYDE